MVNEAIKQFYTTYAPYLDEAIRQNQLLINQPLLDPSNAIASLTACVRIVQAALRAVPNGDANHLLAGVKGVNYSIL